MRGGAWLWLGLGMLGRRESLLVGGRESWQRILGSGVLGPGVLSSSRTVTVVYRGVAAALFLVYHDYDAAGPSYTGSQAQSLFF